MKVTVREGHRTRLILSAMVMDRDILARIATQWTEEGLFSARELNLIGKWCVDWFARYGTAPQNHIQKKWQEHEERFPHDPSTRQLEKLLNWMSGEYEALRQESFNTQYILDRAEEEFNRSRLEQLNLALEESLDAGQVKQAEQQLREWTRVQLTASAGLDALHDKEAIRRALEQEHAERLIEYGGLFDEFFGDALARDQFVAFLAPEKRGKTWWLLDMAYRAAIQRRRTVFVTAGDLSERQVMRRLMRRVTRTGNRERVIGYPEAIRVRQDQAEVRRRQLKVEKVSYDVAVKACRDVMRRRVRSKDSYFKLTVHEADTLSVEQLRGLCEGWAQSGWVPDVVIVDYADILMLPRGIKDPREGTNRIWAGLRGLAQHFHCLVVTATQASAAGGIARRLNRRHFSEDKRKLAHVTGMLGLSQTDEEKQEEIMRLNWIVLREAEYHTTRELWVVGCLDRGLPAVRCCWAGNPGPEAGSEAPG